MFRCGGGPPPHPARAHGNSTSTAPFPSGEHRRATSPLSFLTSAALRQYVSDAGKTADAKSSFRAVHYSPIAIARSCFLRSPPRSDAIESHRTGFSSPQKLLAYADSAFHINGVAPGINVSNARNVARPRHAGDKPQRMWRISNQCS